jgi:Spy/CpxP family protein refolding chaperone
MGKWWQNSDVAKKLQLSDGQISQLDQVFYEHRLKLIDEEAEMQKQDLKLQTLLDADQPDEGQVGSQVDQVLQARGKLEREFTFMNLDLRKVLSVDQWRQLKGIQQERGMMVGMGMGGNVMYHRFKAGPGPGPELGMPAGAAGGDPGPVTIMPGPGLPPPPPDDMD